MDIPHLAEMAKLKGINLIGTGDFTHPLWLQDLKATLIPIIRNRSNLYWSLVYILLCWSLV